MSAAERRKNFEEQVKRGNTALGAGLLMIGNFIMPLLGFIAAYFWIRTRRKEKDENFGQRIGTTISLGIFGLLIAPLAYITAAWEAINYYKEK